MRDLLKDLRTPGTILAEVFVHMDSLGHWNYSLKFVI
jgi:hypothetical protein